MIGQVVALLFGKHPHRPIEHVAASEVEYCICELIERIVFDIDSAMQSAIDLAHAHISIARVFVVHTRNVEVVSYQAHMKQSVHKPERQIALEHSVSSGDYDIDVATEVPSSTVRPAGLDDMQQIAPNQIINSSFYNSLNPLNFGSWNFLSEFFDVFEAHLLTFCKQMLVFPELIYSFNSFVIELSGSCRPNPPNIAKCINGLVSLVLSKAFKLVHFTSFNELEDLIRNSGTDVLDMDDISLVFDFNFEGPDSINSLAVGTGPASILLYFIDLHKSRELFANEVVEWFSL